MKILSKDLKKSVLVFLKITFSCIQLRKSTTNDAGSSTSVKVYHKDVAFTDGEKCAFQARDFPKSQEELKKKKKILKGKE